MRRHVTGPAGACLALMLGTCIASAAGQLDQAASAGKSRSSGVSGYVRMRSNGASTEGRGLQPMEGAHVAVRTSMNGPILHNVRTDAKGYFTIGVRPGRYVLMVVPARPEQRGALSRSINVLVPRGQFASVTLTVDSRARM